MANKELEQLLKNKSMGGSDQPVPIKTVRMARDPIYGEPTEADVHPDEVANMQEHGWQVVD